MDLTSTISQILAAFQAHNWLALVLVLALVVRKWLSPESKFPYELSPNWRPVVFALAGLVIVVVSTRNAGQGWYASLGAGLAAGVATGFFDGLLTATFGSADKAPAWARWIVLVVDEFGGTSGAPPAAGSQSDPAPTPASGDGPVMVKRLAFVRYGRALAFAAVLSAASLIAGCAAWWQSIEQNPAAALAQFVSYVQTFITGAQAIWAVASPLFASSAPAANAQFAKAVVDAQTALAVLQDAERAAEAAQQSTPDFSAAEAAVKDAVARLFAVVQQYTGGDAGSPLGMSAPTGLAHQASVIAAWH